MTLLYDAQQLSLYVGILLLLVGVIGNAINILVFSKVRTYRTNPCTFYFLMSSIHNMFYICLNLPIRILTDYFAINLAGVSDVVCKIRQFLLLIPSLIPITFSCLAIIDQFLVTSKSNYLRNLSQIKWAHRISVIVILFWSLYGVHTLYFEHILSDGMTCGTDNPSLAIYAPIYLLGIICGIPVVIMTLFGLLTYHNIRQTIRSAELHFDRQLIRMTSIHVILVAISLIPYGVNTAYAFITIGIVKDSDRQMKEYLATTIVTLETYLYYVGSCYTFLLTSKRFREKVKNEIFYCRRQNTIGPS
ncbi:unnamed protein product [Adineta steineri]|uniref:G-protein coupled receptors family 1 profile domain-containing protein n=1 Tax=Adineta steineri TaxID=433720 RepID=A0A818P3W5_9BILA|nr:unnamed protein product [Adineta steineri]CAF3613637.1 unnamed protein product [Adineta steineri]